MSEIMKRYRLTYNITFLFLLVASVAGAQIGIGTTTPEGAIDMSSTSYGVVFPRVALTSSAVEAPVTNPAGGSLAVGTAIYNTATTTNGSNDVYPGIYAWSGTQWSPQFIMEDYQKFEQTGGVQRTTIRESYSNPEPTDVDNVAGLTGQTFTPKYSGTYRVEVRVNFSAGEIADFTALDNISLATMEGAFFFSMSGTGIDIDPTSTSYDYTEGWIYTHSYSAYNENESPALNDIQNVHVGSVVYHLYLLAGDTYTFNVSNCTYTGNDYFVNNGDSGTGRGYIGRDFPCSVEFKFLGD